MTQWPSLLQKPFLLSNCELANRWFSQIADQLLNGCHLLIGKTPHRIAEIEFYYFSEDHPDVFTHRDSLQLECGCWYFHKTRGEYRSGSFKGLDLTFGDDKAYGGILIRSLETQNGTLIAGPCLCVDHLLGQVGMKTISELDQAIGDKKAWDAQSLLYLSMLDTSRQSAIFRSARVGLSLKRWKNADKPTPYIMRSYRYLTEPRKISKGKVHIALSLYAQGVDAQKISEITGCPRRSVQGYIENYEIGRKEQDFASYLGVELATQALCRLHGLCQAKHG